MRLPMPLAAPVTKATFPWSRMRSLLEAALGARCGPEKIRRSRVGTAPVGSDWGDEALLSDPLAAPEFRSAAYRCETAVSAVASARTRVYAEVLELAVEMSPLHPDRLGELADAAAGDAELVQEVRTLELLARLAKRQREIDALVHGR